MLENTRHSVSVPVGPAVPGPQRRAPETLRQATQPRLSYDAAEQEARELRSSIGDVFDVPGPSNAGASHRRVVPLTPTDVQASVARPTDKHQFEALTNEAKQFRPSITKGDITRFFGFQRGRAASGNNLRNLLAFIRVLDKYAVGEVSELEGCPQNRWGATDSATMARALDMEPTVLRTYASKAKYVGAPEWMPVVTRRLGLGGYAERNKITTHAADPDANLNVAPVPRPSNAGAIHQGTALSYTTALEECKQIQPSIRDVDIYKFFGKFTFAKQDVHRKLLAFLRVLCRHNVATLGDLVEVPRLRGGVVDIRKFAKDLGLYEDFFYKLRGTLKRSENENENSSNWMHVIVERLAPSDPRNRPGLTEEYARTLGIDEGSEG